VPCLLPTLPYLLDEWWRRRCTHKLMGPTSIFRMLGPPPSSLRTMQRLFVCSRMRRVCASKLPWHDKKQSYRTRTLHTSNFACNFLGKEIHRMPLFFIME
jgi:hypothetical protein